MTCIFLRMKDDADENLNLIMCSLSAKDALLYLRVFFCMFVCLAVKRWGFLFGSFIFEVFFVLFYFR